MKQKILNTFKIYSLETFLEGLVFLGMGFLLSFAKISDVFSPFCLAFCVAAVRERAICSFAGGLLGMLFNLTSGNLVYFFALMVGFLIKFVFSGRSSFSSALVSIVALAGPKLIFIFLVPSSVYTWLIDYCEVVFCAAMTVLFSKVLRKKPKGLIINFYDFVGFFFIAIAVLISLCSFNFLGVNFGKLFSLFFILEALVLIGIGSVAVVGVCSIVGLALFAKNFAVFGVIIAVSGFLSAVFSSLSRFFKLVVFNLIFFICAIFWGGLQINSLLEVFIASVLVYVFPISFFEGLFSKNSLSKIKSKVKLNDELSFKLQFTAKTLLDLQTSIEQCAKSFDVISYKDMQDVYKQVALSVCKNCGLNTFCWVASYNETARCFNEISVCLRENGRIEAEKMPVFLKTKCCKLGALINSINFEYKDYICKEQTSRRINEVRAIAAEQFTGMAELLVEMSQDILEVARIDDEVCDAVAQIFKNESIHFEGLFCFLDKFDRLTIDIYLKSIPAKGELKKIAELISVAIDKEIEFPTITQAKTSFKISFFESATLKIEFAAKQTSPNNNTCCGDSYDYFMDGKGYAHLILSDGMGNGKRAAVDSLMTCFTLRKLIETGFGFNSTLKLLNLSFSIKSKEESLATIDTCTIDLYSGCVKFVKAGATVSYLSIGGKISKYASTSLPIGIIQGVSFDSKEFKLSRGDVIVMVSDGAVATDFDWISKELELMLSKSAQAIAQKLLELAKKQSDPNHKDDITVLVAKLV